MGVMDWIRGRRPDRCAQAGRMMASNERARIEASLVELQALYPALDVNRLKFRLWVTATAPYPFVAENSQCDDEHLDRFFSAFWPRIRKELQDDFPGQDDIQVRFDSAVEELVSCFRDDHRSLSPEKAVGATGKRVAAFLEIPDGATLASVWAAMGIEYGYRMVAVAELLNKLPTIK